MTIDIDCWVYCKCSMSWWWCIFFIELLNENEYLAHPESAAREDESETQKIAN